MAGSETSGEIDWNQFLEGCLEGVPPFPFEVEYENMREVKPSALTYVNMGLFNRAIENGFPGIVISVCDYTREMLSFSFARAVDNVFSGSSIWDFRTTFPEIGELVSVGKMIAEYRGVEEHDDGRGLRIRLKQPRGYKKKDWITNFVPLKDLPVIHPAPPGSAPTTEHKIKEREVREAYKALPYKAKKLVSLNPTVSKSVVLATSSSPYANIPPTMLKRASMIFDDGDIDINECLKTARLADDELKTSYNYEATGLPSLIMAGRNGEGIADVASIYDYLGKGGKVDLIAVEAPTAECLDNNKGYLEAIIDEFNVPVIVFCEESVLRRADMFEELGLPVFIWDKTSISDVIGKSEGAHVSVTHRERCVATANLRLRTAQDTGELTKIAEVLYSLADNRDRLPERDEGALLSLINVLVNR